MTWRGLVHHAPRCERPRRSVAELVLTPPSWSCAQCFQVGSSGGTASILRAMAANPADPELQGEACTAFTNLSHNCDRNRKLVVEGGGLILILNAMQARRTPTPNGSPSAIYICQSCALSTSCLLRASVSRFMRRCCWLWWRWICLTVFIFFCLKPASSSVLFENVVTNYQHTNHKTTQSIFHHTRRRYKFLWHDQI